MSREGLKKQGYLYKLPVKGLVKKWTKRWFMLYGTTHEGVVRIEYYDNPESMVSGSGKRTIPLRECTGISTTIGSKVHPYAFQFTSLLGNHILAGETQPEVDSWIESINTTIHEDKMRRRRSKAQSRVATTSGSDIEQSSEKGISYKNKVDSGTYRVTVEENETSRKMNLTGSYNLELGPSKIALVAASKAVIFSFSYRFLKNYGKQSGQFHFETGKNSPIGEGRLVFVTTCSKEIFGVVHNNIKRLKEQVQRKLSSDGSLPKSSQPSTQRKVSSDGGPTKSSQAPLRTKPQPPSSQSSSVSRTSIGGRPSSRHSTEIAAESVPGKYRTSKNMEEVATPSSNQQETKPDDDPSALYAVVDKSKKTSKRKDQKPKPVAPQPYGAKGTGQESNQTDQLAPQGARDYRLSTMLVEVDDNAFNDSFDEDDGDDDGNEYDENLEPLAEGVMNPFDDGDLDARETIDGGTTPNGGNTQHDTEITSSPQTDTAQGKPETSSSLLIDVAESNADNSSGNSETNNTPVNDVAQNNAEATTSSPLIDIAQGSIETTSSPLIDIAQSNTVSASPGKHQVNEEISFFSATNESTGNGFPTEPVKSSNMQNVMNELDFGFGPGNLEPKKNRSETTEGKLSTPEFQANASAGKLVTTANAENVQAEQAPNLLGDLGFDFGATNFHQGESTPMTTAGNIAPLPDLNFSFGDLPPIPGFDAPGNDPFSSPTTNQPSMTGNIADLDFNSLDTNFFEKLDAIDVQGQASNTAGPGAMGFDDDWGETNTAL